MEQGRSGFVRRATGDVLPTLELPSMTILYSGGLAPAAVARVAMDEFGGDSG